MRVPHRLTIGLVVLFCALAVLSEHAQARSRREENRAPQRPSAGEGGSGEAAGAVVGGVTMTASSGTAGIATGDRAYFLLVPRLSGPTFIQVMDFDADGRPMFGDLHPTGGIGRGSSTIQDVVADPVNRLLFAANSISQDIAVFRFFDDGSIEALPGSPYPVANTPGRLALNGRGDVLYGLERLTDLAAYSFDAAVGLSPLQALPVSTWQGDVALDPLGRYLYAAIEPGEILGFDVDPSGELVPFAGPPLTIAGTTPQSTEITRDGRRLISMDVFGPLSVFDVGPSGELAEVVGSPVYGGFNATTLAVSDLGYAYTGDSFAGVFEGAIKGFAVDGDEVVEIPGASLVFPLFGWLLLFDNPGERWLYAVRGDDIYQYTIGPLGNLGFLSVTELVFSERPVAVVFVPRVPANEFPVAICNDASAPADEACLADAVVDAGSFDPDGDPIIVELAPAGPYGLGQTEVTLTVTDDQGASASCTAVVTVEDASLPDLSLEVEPRVLWPPNHRMVDVAVTVTAQDNCGPPDVALTEVSSNEDAAGDIADAEIGTHDLLLQLRAERAGAATGRTYSIRYSATDGSGNEVSASVHVVVPHDRGRPR